jgi:hypothetical protein
MIAIAVVGFLMLVVTIRRGWHPYPLVGRAYRGGANPGLFWLAIIIEILLIVASLALHFSN